MIYVVINPKAGSYTESKCNYLMSSLSTCIDQINKSKPDLFLEIKILKTTHSNHAKEFLMELDISIINSITLIVVVGGDGLVHEVVNGVFKNKRLHYPPPLIVCPFGSKNHLAKMLGITKIEQVIEMFKRIRTNDYKLKAVYPTILTNISHEEQNVLLADEFDWTYSISTIVCGIPALVNENASSVSSYLPSILAPLKYDIGTTVGLFNTGREYLTITTQNEILTNVIGVFVQTTPTCNNFIIDSEIDGTETNVNFAVMKDVNTAKMIYELSKEKLGYTLNLHRSHNKESYIHIAPKNQTDKPTLTVDGQNEKFQLPVMITKSDTSLMFLC